MIHGQNMNCYQVNVYRNFRFPVLQYHVEEMHLCMLYRILRVFFTKSGHIWAVLSHPCKARRIFVTRAIFFNFFGCGHKVGSVSRIYRYIQSLMHYSRQLKSVVFIHTHTCMLSVSGSEYAGQLEKRYSSKSTYSNSFTHTQHADSG